MLEKIWDVYTTCLPVVIGGVLIVFTILLPIALLGGLDDTEKK